MPIVYAGTQHYKTEVDTSGAEQGAQRGAQIMRGFATTVRGAGIELQMFGQQLLTMVAGTVGAFMTWEDAFAGVRKTVDATDEQFDLLQEGLRDMALRLPIAAAELAGITEIAGQLGIRGVDNLLIFTETVAKMAVTTNLTNEAAALAFAGIAQVMRLPIDQTDRLGSAVVDLGNKFAATETEIVNTALRFVGTAQAVGLTTQEVLGISNAMASLRITAEMGGSAVSRVFLEMVEAAASGDAQLTEFARIMGVTATESQRLIDTDPATAFLRFIQGMDKSISRGEDWTQILKDLDLNNIRVRDTVLRLAGGHTTLADSLGVANTAWAENTALNVEAEKRFRTLSSQIQLFKNFLNEVNIVLGESLAPTIEMIVERVKPFLQQIAEFMQEHPRVAAAIMGIAAALGALAFIMGTLLIVFAVVSVTLAIFSGPLILIALAIAALIAGVAALIIFWPEVSKAFMEFTRAVQDFFTKEGFLKRMEQLGKFLEETALPALQEALKVIGEWLKDNWQYVLAYAFGGFGGVLIYHFRDELKVVGEWLKDHWQYVLAFVFGGFSGILIYHFKDELREFAQWVLAQIPSLLGRLGEVIKDNWQYILAFALGGIAGVLIFQFREEILDFGREIRNRLKEFGVGIRNTLKEFGQDIKRTLVDMFKPLTEPVRLWAIEVYTTLRFWWDKIVVLFEMIGPPIKAALTEVFQWLFEGFSRAFQRIWDITNFFWSIYRQIWDFGFNLLIDMIPPAFNRMRDNFTFYLNLLWESIRFWWVIISTVFKTSFDLTVNGVITWFLILKALFTAGLSNLWAFTQFYWTLIKNTFLIFWNLVFGISRIFWALLRGDWDAAFRALKNTASTVWNLIKEIFRAALTAIKTTMANTWQGMKDTFNAAWAGIKEAVFIGLSGLEGIFRAVFNGIITVVETAVNNIIGGINDLASGVDKVSGLFNKLPGVPDLPDVPTIDTISIPRAGAGGFAFSPTLAVVGDVPEAIIPLHKMGSLGNTFWAPVYITVKADRPEDFWEQLNRSFKGEDT